MVDHHASRGDSPAWIIGFGHLARALRALPEPFGCSVEANDPWLPDEVLAGVTGEDAGFLGRPELGPAARGGRAALEIGRLVVGDAEGLLAGLPPVARKHAERETVGRLRGRPTTPAALGS
jgi:hypothetical protein